MAAALAVGSAVVAVVVGLGAWGGGLGSGEGAEVVCRRLGTSLERITFGIVLLQLLLQFQTITVTISITITVTTIHGSGLLD